MFQMFRFFLTFFKSVKTSTFFGLAKPPPSPPLLQKPPKITEHLEHVEHPFRINNLAKNPKWNMKEHAEHLSLI